MVDILFAPAIVVGLFLFIVIAIIILRMGATPFGRRKQANTSASSKRSKKLRLPVFLFGIVAGMLVGAVIGYIVILRPDTNFVFPTTGNAQIKVTGTVLPPPTPTHNTGAGPKIRELTTNATEYLKGEIPQYEKFEITFQVDTTAQNLQFPYDPTPPPGLKPAMGISVDAHFTSDNWQTVFVQPAFYYQEFEHSPKDGEEWLYPTDNFTWKVRFAPHQEGEWQFKLTAQDASGLYETDTFSFAVAPSTNKGFIRVSQTDPRYFEFEDKTYFPALGYNFGIRADEDSFRTMSENGIQLIRTWLPSQLSIFGSAWSSPVPYGAAPWPSEPSARLNYDAASPFNLTPGVNPPLARPDSEVFLWLSHNETVSEDGNQWDFVPCAVWGWQSPQLPVKPNVDYRIRVRYKEQALTGPKVAGQPYGFAVKVGGWLWDEADETLRCYYPDAGTLLAASYSTTDNWSHYPDPENEGWQILEGRFNSEDRDFLGNLYLAIENASSGHVLVDYVWLEEDLGDGEYGPNVIHKPWMAFHQYFDQRNSYAFDRVLDLAAKYGIYLKLVILEKNDFILNIFEPDGTLSALPPYENSEPLFFGEGREIEGKTKIRWLQEAWWRYLQARWGYSPHIHSWELLNEGDPYDTLHYILVDELGKYLQESFIPQGQQTKHPNMHLVTTSFWHSFPNEFWSSPEYPYVDYADVHHYAQESNTAPFDYIYDLSDFYDAALISQQLSMFHGAKQPDGPGKPVIRGETGFIFDDADPFSQNVTDGLWLHNMIWAGINSGGLIESFWTGGRWISRFYEADSHDHRPMFRTYFNFIKDIPLNNGHYQEAAAAVSQPDLRVWGQKDLVNGQAHLWIQNKNHTWKNVLDGTSIPPVSGTITVPGFQANQTYTVEWWDTYQPDRSVQLINAETIRASPNGSIEINIEELTTDIAFKIVSP
jgi:hypothetical protein